MEKMLIMSEYIHYLYDVYNSYEHMNEYNNSSKMKSKRMESTKAYNNARSSSRVKDVFIQGSQSQIVMFPPYGGTMFEYV